MKKLQPTSDRAHSVRLCYQPTTRSLCSWTTPSPRPSSSCADSTGRSCRRQRYDLQRPFLTGERGRCTHGAPNPTNRVLGRGW